VMDIPSALYQATGAYIWFYCPLPQDNWYRPPPIGQFPQYNNTTDCDPRESPRSFANKVITHPLVVHPDCPSHPPVHVSLSLILMISTTTS